MFHLGCEEKFLHGFVALEFYVVLIYTIFNELTGSFSRYTARKENMLKNYCTKVNEEMNGFSI